MRGAPDCSWRVPIHPEEPPPATPPHFPKLLRLVALSATCEHNFGKNRARNATVQVAMPRMKMSANGFATSRADMRPPGLSHKYV